MANKNDQQLATEVQRKELKSKAQKLISKGKVDKALETYLQLWKISQKDFRVKMKIGELLHKLGRKPEAIAVYKKVAEAYAKDGFLIQGISVCKIILDLDSSEVGIKTLLSNLYSKRGMDKESRLVSGKPLKPVAPAKPAVVVEKETLSTEDLLDDFFNEDFPISEKQLPTIPLFSELEEDEFAAVIDSLSPWKIPEDTVVIQEGTPADSMFIISDGRIQVRTQNREGQRLNLAVLNPGDFFGEIGLFSNTLRTASCVAIEETELLELKRSGFDEIIERFPRVKKVLHNFYKVRVLDTILAKSELFGSLNPEIRRELLNRFTLHEYGEGQVIVGEGDSGDSLFMIRDGQVEVRTQKDGKPVSLAVLSAGDFFGEVALISGKKRTASVYSKGKSVCIRLDKKDFDWALEKCPEVKKVVDAYVQKRVEGTISLISKLDW